MSKRDKHAINTGIKVKDGPIWEQIGITTYPKKTEIKPADEQWVMDKVYDTIDDNRNLTQTTAQRSNIYVERLTNLNFRLDVYVEHPVDMLPVQELADMTGEYQQRINGNKDMKVASHRIVSKQFADQLILHK